MDSMEINNQIKQENVMKPALNALVLPIMSAHNVKLIIICLLRKWLVKRFALLDILLSLLKHHLIPENVKSVIISAQNVLVVIIRNAQNAVKDSICSQIFLTYVDNFAQMVIIKILKLDHVQYAQVHA